MKIILSDMKNILDGKNSRLLDITEENLSELEHIAKKKKTNKNKPKLFKRNI